MKNIPLLLLVGIWLASCTPIVVNAPDSTDHLLSGQVLFGELIETSDINADQILAMNGEMRTYVASKMSRNLPARSRLNTLIRGMIDDGLLTLDYDPNLTYTAIETFQKRQGNCLSFSILFAALAREANLDATFQIVDIPPSFSADGEMVLLNNHINILVEGVRSDVNFTRDYVVDFNTAEYNGNYETKKVTDKYAIALYYSNLAVESMQKENLKDAFRYLKKGVETDPEIAGLWVNLGALYSKNELFEMAVQAYHQALSIEPSNRSALVNLANALNSLGRKEESEYYAEKVTYYRDLNPYYHYYQAQAAYKRNDLDEAQSYLADAIKLKGNEHQFYYLRGLIHQQRKEYKLAARDYEKARDAAENAELISAYTRKLDALGTHLR